MRNNDRREHKTTAGPANAGASTAADARHNRKTGLQRLHDSRDVLEDIANSDLPCAWVADALLDIDDDRDTDDTDADSDGSTPGGDAGGD